jgi:hypothetical protein
MENARSSHSLIGGVNMSTPNLEQQEVVFFVVGAGTDAPGYKLVWDGHRIKVVPVPGWDPEQMAELGAALRVISAAGRMKHPEGQTILKAAAQVAQSELSRTAGQAGKEGGQTVVLLAA